MLRFSHGLPVSLWFDKYKQMEMWECFRFVLWQWSCNDYCVMETVNFIFCGWNPDHCCQVGQQIICRQSRQQTQSVKVTRAFLRNHRRPKTDDKTNKCGDNPFLNISFFQSLTSINCTQGNITYSETKIFGDLQNFRVLLKSDQFKISTHLHPHLGVCFA